MRIFVSSTFEDLRDHRAAAVRVLRQLGHEVLAMEDMVAAADTPLAKVLEMVDRAEAYVGIFAWRYGYVPQPGPALPPGPVVPRVTPGDTSITHCEYLRARQNGLPVLAFLLDERAPWPPAMIDGHQRGIGAPVDASRIRDLRSQLQQERIVAWFTTPADLEARVAAGITMTGLSRQIDLAESVSLGMGPGSAPLNDSGGYAIAQGIAAALPTQRVLKVDLQEVWWSTRLYLAAALAERLTQVRWLLIVDSGRRPDEEHFVGLVGTSAVLAVLARMHPQTTRFERAAARLQLPDDTAGAAHALIDRAWLPAFAGPGLDAYDAERQVQKTAADDRLQRWFGGALLSTAVPIADLGRASVVDLLLLVSYPSELVPVSTSREVLPGASRHAVVDVVDKSSLNRRLALSYLQELKERARIA
jgi:hypothetical protein